MRGLRVEATCLQLLDPLLGLVRCLGAEIVAALGCLELKAGLGVMFVHVSAVHGHDRVERLLGR